MESNVRSETAEVVVIDEVGFKPVITIVPEEGYENTVLRKNGISPDEAMRIKNTVEREHNYDGDTARGRKYSARSDHSEVKLKKQRARAKAAKKSRKKNRK